VYPDPDARNSECSSGIYVVSSISMQDLEEMSKGPFPVYGNYEQVKQLSGDNTKYEDQRFKQDKRAIRGTGTPARVKQGNTVELITFWGKEDLDGDGVREECQIVIANRSVVVRAVRNPFDHQERPIIRGVLFPVPQEWFGMGLIEPVIGLINELVTIRRQNLDMNNLIINRMWKVHSMADVDLDTLVSSPNGIIVTGDMDGVVQLNQDPIPVSPLEMSQLIQADIENATAPKSIQGAPSSGALGRTARGAQLIISQALEKFGMGAKLIEETVVRKVLVMFKKLNEQFLDSDEVLQEFYGTATKEQLTPEEIRNDLDFELLGISETVTREATINQLISFYNLAAQNPNVDINAVLSQIWNLMQVGKSASDIIKEAQPQTGMMPLPQPNQEIQAQVEQNGSGGNISVPQQ